ncbi:hypothetical protein BCV70DRAFT_200136 [Testicularia cyperi]|uniref:Uncharacterized protein n=1 Tax=Testicularia cyperi TaxID=1882483 RepID=A0A317XRN4_9BASI|nr:hypothetical protein BCV70DRAFT_200136 [Testicularia cyperi]
MSTATYQTPVRQPYGQQFATPLRTTSGSSTSGLTPNANAAGGDTPGSSKSVRFQPQPLPHQYQALGQQHQLLVLQQQQQQQQQQQLQLHQQQQQLQQQPSSLFNRSASSSTTALAPASAGAGAVQRSSSAALSTPSTPAKSASSATPATPGMASSSSTAWLPPASRAALSRRLRWNASALALLWITPLLTTKPKDLYWSALDMVYETFGGNLDERVDAIFGWVLWAASIVLLFNTVEASILVRRKEVEPASAALAGVVGGEKGGAAGLGSQLTARGAPASATPTGAAATLLGFQSPGSAKSLNFVAASRLKGSPKTRVSSIGPGSPISSSSPSSSSTAAAAGVLARRNSPNKTPSGANANANGSATAAGSTMSEDTTDYSRFSPSRQRHGGHGFGSPLSSNTGAAAGASSNNIASPFARIGRRTTSSTFAHHSPIPLGLGAGGRSHDLSNLSVAYSDDADAEDFLADDSFEVERALRSIRNSLPPQPQQQPQQQQLPLSTSATASVTPVKT